MIIRPTFGSAILANLRLLGTFRSLCFVVGWPLKSCSHSGIFPSVIGSSTVKRKSRKVPIIDRLGRWTVTCYCNDGVIGVTFRGVTWLVRLIYICGNCYIYGCHLRGKYATFVRNITFVVIF